MWPPSRIGIGKKFTIARFALKNVKNKSSLDVLCVASEVAAIAIVPGPPRFFGEIFPLISLAKVFPTRTMSFLTCLAPFEKASPQVADLYCF